MSKITVKELKQQLVDTVSSIDKSKLTIFDLKTLSETVEVLSMIKTADMDYTDLLVKSMGMGLCSKPNVISELKEEA